MSGNQAPSSDPNQTTVAIINFLGGKGQRLAEIAMVLVFAIVWAALCAVLGTGLAGLLPLLAVVLLLVHIGVRRRSLRTAFGRDTASFARRWPGKLLIAAVLVAIPTTMVFASLRAGTYADNSWIALIMLATLTVTYLVSRRLLLTVMVAGVIVSITSWVLVPHLAAASNGDRTVLAQLTQERGMGTLFGFHNVAVAQIDLGSAQPVRLAGLGADSTTPMEVGSLTKAMTGLVIADSVHRGEIRMDLPVSTYLPQLAGSKAGTVNMQELVTHTSGYVEFGAATLSRAAWAAPLGRNFLTTDAAQMTQEARDGTLETRGSYAYSSLGAAMAGAAVAAAAGMNYADLMRTRLFAPLGMTHTVIENDHVLVSGGTSASGLPVQPWVFKAYAPAGAAVSTSGDLAKLATALLNGTAPGMAALTPTTQTAQHNTRIGDFWHVSTWQTGQIVTWHSGQTGGYTSYFGLDRAHRKAIIVLSDVASPGTEDLGIDLLAQRK